MWSVSSKRLIRNVFCCSKQQRLKLSNPAKLQKELTHIIVGAGTAGCVLANRLSEDPNNRVLLLESGPKDHWWNWKIHMPAALRYNLRDDKYNWFYHTLPQKHLNNRIMYWPRGKVWGGSSALNAMVYVRGHPNDYNRWEKEGATGWAYKDCLPYFKKSQSHNLANGPETFRGHQGPLHVTQAACTNPLHQAWLQAGVEAGYGYTEDMNGYRQEGVGKMDMTIHKGRRWSASQAYVWPALKRSSLSIRSNILATRIIFDQKKAVGIEYVEHGGSKQTKQVHCSDSVILCAGATNSPQLLMLSGIGPADQLKKNDIKVIQDLAGVGQNLQDHLEVVVQQACTQPVSLYNKSTWKFPHNMIRIGLQWFATQTGEGASSHMESGGFVRTRPDEPHPNIQFHFWPSTYQDQGRKMATRHAYQLHAGPLRPKSSGHLQLQSKDPRCPPLIQPNYLSSEQDKQELRDGIRIAREIFSQRAFDPYRGEEIAPRKEVKSDEAIDAFVRECATSGYHPSCTCKMGSSDDKTSVIDPQTLNVFGVENLKIVDASIMPSIVSGNLNGPVIMLAEKAADLIQGKKLPSENPEIWEPTKNVFTGEKTNDYDTARSREALAF